MPSTQTPKDTTPNMDRVMEYMSDSILNSQHDFCNNMDDKLKTAMIDTITATDDINKKFFEEEGSALLELSNSARNYVCLTLERKKDVKKFSGQLYEEAKNKPAANIANAIPAMIKVNKLMLTSFITTSSRSTEKSLELLRLLIHTINMNNKWLSVLHHSLKTVTINSSVFSLAKLSITAQKEIDENTRNSTKDWRSHDQ